MRKFKFRTYNKDSFTYFDLDLLNDESRAFYINEIKDYQVMQFTGLLDKNGAETYEGDICSFVIFDYLDNDTAYTSIVIFQQGSFGFIIKNHQNEECFYELSHILSQDDEVEVIGNIYQNKYLLNEI